jgi:hypothetical protein
MMASIGEVPLNTARFREQLQRQKGFIQRSCALYDAGFSDEATRIATSVRILLYDTNRSISLLTHLGLKDKIHLHSTVQDVSLEKGLVLFEGCILMSLRGVEPSLGRGHKRFMTVNDWWNQIVLISGPGNIYSRRDIILETVNKDGGAHVDSKIGSNLERLVDGILTFQIGPLHRIDKARQIKNHHFIYLRQFGYELLNSPEL